MSVQGATLLAVRLGGRIASTLGFGPDAVEGHDVTAHSVMADGVAGGSHYTGPAVREPGGFSGQARAARGRG
ncbi:hypothetical protein [Streptomyces sp. NBC_00059]|uniref:hypothetical protein n=1 Tax=Streptomyces sp. NBC_00059 TaxID=2975635 RepID=UPI00225156D7|nr:hypothetical protein [Streptomyces sp. NBC_00059]MCX5417623.1 hypothetical protein [Streptomyces sp. NBC_00059]